MARGGQLEDTTRDRYDDLIRLYIAPTLGPMRAAKLDAQMLERWYARLQANDASQSRSGCAGRSVGCHPALRAARPLQDV
jgi:hypothetical protein